MGREGRGRKKNFFPERISKQHQTLFFVFFLLPQKLSQFILCRLFSLSLSFSHYFFVLSLFSFRENLISLPFFLSLSLSRSFSLFLEPKPVLALSFFPSFFPPFRSQLQQSHSAAAAGYELLLRLLLLLLLLLRRGGRRRRRGRRGRGGRRRRGRSYLAGDHGVLLLDVDLAGRLAGEVLAALRALVVEGVHDRVVVGDVLAQALLAGALEAALVALLQVGVHRFGVVDLQAGGRDAGREGGERERVG